MYFCADVTGLREALTLNKQSLLCILTIQFECQRHFSIDHSYWFTNALQLVDVLTFA